MHIRDLPTPALVADVDALNHNLTHAAATLPGTRCRPHVKAHKSTGLARMQAAVGHRTFTCATPLELVGMARAGLGDDLLLANEVVDASRLRAMASVQDIAMVTVAVDSEVTIRAAAAAGIRHVLIDVNVGLPRCGCDPSAAGRLAEVARAAGLDVRGVMGYEGQLMAVVDRAERTQKTGSGMELLRQAHALVGGGILSAGGTGTYDIHAPDTEVQAGSYLLMDTYYGRLGLPFRQALFIAASVISVQPQWIVADAGLKAMGMDHGNPSIDGATVWFCGDEHITYSLPEDAERPQVGHRVLITPAHVDPTMALHEHIHLVQGGQVVDTLAIDLRGW